MYIGNKAIYASINQKLSVGAKVWLRNSRKDSKKGDKMEEKWTGPYTIEEDTGKGSYRLKNKSGTILKNAVNIARLKLHHDSRSVQCTIL